MAKQFQEVINALEADEQVRVVVFDSAVDDYFLNHSDFLAKLKPDLPTARSHGPATLAGLSCTADSHTQSSPSLSSAAGRPATVARLRSPAT